MLGKLKNLRVGEKIGLGFVVIGLIFFANILFVFNLLNQTEELRDRVMELRTPTAQNSFKMLNGVNRSLAALRGWLLLGEEHFKQERQQAWSKDIDSAEKILNELSEHWTNPKNVERFRTIKEKLKELRAYQQEIESLSRNSQLPLANKNLSETAATTASAINTLLSEMAENQQVLLRFDLEESKRLSSRGMSLLWATLFVSVSLGFLIAMAITFSITRPLRRITEFSMGVAAGNLNQERLQRDSEDEIGILTHNFNEMAFGLITDLQEKEARNFALLYNIMDPLIEINDQGLIEIFNPAAVKVFGYSASEVMGKNVKMLMPEPYQSEHDGYIRNYRETGQAKVIGTGREVTGKRKDGTVFPMEIAVNEIKVGDKTMYVSICRDITERKNAVQELVDSRVTLEKQNWLKTGLAELHDMMRGEQGEDTLSQNIINYLAGRLNVLIGAIYLSENGEMRFTAGYAFNQGMKNTKHYQKGEGPVGQAALEKKSILIKDLPDDSIRIQSGFIDASPRNLLVIPIIFEEEVIGVLELASLDEIQQDHREFLNQAVEAIAINLHSSRSRTRLEELLESKK